MKLWIRVDASVAADPKVIAFAAELGISVPSALGHLVAVWGSVAEHCPNGELHSVSSTVIERWALWEPRRGQKRGTFAEAFHRTFVTDGTINGWARRQGKLIERKERERERWHRRNSAESTRSQRGASAATVRNGTVRSTTSTKTLSPPDGGRPAEEPEPRASEPSPAVVPASPAPPAKRQAAPKYPHFARADCDRLHGVWGAELGMVDYARFRKAFGRLFPESPPYSVDEVALAIKEACGIAQYQGGFALRTLTPETFVDRVSYWVDLTRRPMLIDGIATERGKLWGLAA